MIDFQSEEQADGAPHDEQPHVDLIDTSRPLTRNIEEIVAAAYIVEAELNHQAERINPDRARTDSERKHLKDLKDGYTEAYHHVRVLRRYQEGRLHRQRTTGSAAPESVEPSVESSAPVFSSRDDDPHGARNG